MNTSFLSALVAVVLAGLTIFNTAAGPAPRASAAATPPHKIFTPSHLISSLPNKHLHGAKPAVEKSAVKSKDKKKKGARHWAGRWDFATWAAVHRGTATIEGQVHGATGSLLGGAKVFLRSAKGHPLKSVADKHITHTSAGGVFIMRHVRIGTFRVRAEHGKASGHTLIHVRGGVTNTVSVKV